MEIICKHRTFIGEGPIWNRFDNKLYFVNSKENEIIKLSIKSGEYETLKLAFPVSALAFNRQGQMLLSCPDGAYFLNSDYSRTLMYNANECNILYGNDAKVGPDGRFYIGTMSSKRKGVSDKVDGKLYSIDTSGTVKILLDSLLLSNGMEWSIDEKYLYHTDSDTGIIKEYSFNKQTGDIAFTGRSVEVTGVDGFTIDKNGILYVACWGQGHIALVDSAKMQITGYIEVPTKIPASCCFAGENLDSLIVVTATFMQDVTIEKNAGFTFICKTNSQGRTPYLF